jgi:hypothetical protein
MPVPLYGRTRTMVRCASLILRLRSATRIWAAQSIGVVPRLDLPLYIITQHVDYIVKAAAYKGGLVGQDHTPGSTGRSCGHA